MSLWPRSKCVLIPTGDERGDFRCKESFLDDCKYHKQSIWTWGWLGYCKHLKIVSVGIHDYHVCECQEAHNEVLLDKYNKAKSVIDHMFQPCDTCSIGSTIKQIIDDKEPFDVIKKESRDEQE